MHEESEKKGWFKRVKQEEAKAFEELDVLLRALDRVFNPENLPLSTTDYTTKDFYPEMVIIRDGLLRVLNILEQLIPDSQKNMYWFQKYAEQTYLSDKKRDYLRTKLYKQDSPEKSLLLLYDSFINLKGIINDLLKTKKISYSGFKNFGDVVSKSIRENRYFNPFEKEIHPEFDRIKIPEIVSIVKSIQESDKKRTVSGILIYLFRILRFIDYIEPSSHTPTSLNCSLLILLLIRSEIRSFIETLKTLNSTLNDKQMKEFIEMLVFQFSVESKRAFEQELRDITAITSVNRIRGKIENSCGIVQHLVEESIVQVARLFTPDIKGEDIFPSYTTRLEQSLKLREDVYTLYKFFDIFEQVAAEKKELLKPIFHALRAYMLYFESFTFRLLRHDDYEEFNKFFSEFLSLNEDVLTGGALEKLLQNIHSFKIFLETTVRFISQRTELHGKDIDIKKVNSILVQFLSEDKQMMDYLTTRGII